MVVIRLIAPVVESIPNRLRPLPVLMLYVIVPSGGVSASVHANVTSTPTAVLSGNDFRTEYDGQLGFVFCPEITYHV